MPGPAAVQCSVPDCDFVRPAICPKWEILSPERYAPVPFSLSPWRPRWSGQAGAQVRPKPAPVSRPEVDLGATEHDWRFFNLYLH